MAAANTREQSSLSSYESSRATHVHVDWTVDFGARQLRGRVATRVVGVKEATQVVLDTNHLVILGASVNGARRARAAPRGCHARSRAHARAAS